MCAPLKVRGAGSAGSSFRKCTIMFQLPVVSLDDHARDLSLIHATRGDHDAAGFDGEGHCLRDPKNIIFKEGLSTGNSRNAVCLD